MMRNTVESYSPKATRKQARHDRSLAIILWSLWTFAVVGTAFWYWYSDVVAHQPVNMIGLVIYSILAGLVGMLVLTLVEQWLEPLRFID